jgi:hypothetical protein
MPRKPRLRVALIKCGNCGQRYSNPLAHVCRPKSSRRRGRTRVAPQASFTCPRCGAAYANPLTHTCKSKRGDFRRRKKAAQQRERKAKRDANRHDYATCPEGENCDRFPCRVYAEGYAAGFADGHSAGYSAGYDAGFQAGQDAAKD